LCWLITDGGFYRWRRLGIGLHSGREASANTPRDQMSVSTCFAKENNAGHQGTVIAVEFCQGISKVR
jgi:hypothetical protein